MGAFVAFQNKIFLEVCTAVQMAGEVASILAAIAALPAADQEKVSAQWSREVKRTASIRASPRVRLDAQSNHVRIGATMGHNLKNSSRTKALSSASKPQPLGALQLFCLNCWRGTLLSISR